VSRLAWTTGTENADALAARAFGSEPTDLYVDFDRPLQLVQTDVLRNCLLRADGSAFTTEEITLWTIAKRRQGLLAIAVSTNGFLRQWVAICNACDEKLDLEINLTDFKRDCSVNELAFRDCFIRLPCPSDLDRVASDDVLLPRILIKGTPPTGAWETEVEAMLSSADPLADLELGTQCPECDNAVVVPLVLESYLMDELNQQMLALMDQIHVLALAYHWSETQILALSQSRRQYYLARIKEAWAA